MKKVLIVLGVVAMLIAIAFVAFDSSTTQSTNNEGIMPVATN